MKQVGKTPPTIALKISASTILTGAVLLIFTLGCKSNNQSTSPDNTLMPLAADTTKQPDGSFSVLTYNVAGLPAILSSGNPAKNTGTIGRLINDYDIVHVQEDFNYHAHLKEFALHPHSSPTSGGIPFGDGLNTLSSFPFTDFQRIMWENCNGTDCIIPKGFTVARHTLGPGTTIDFYNAHTNAGGGANDMTARQSNVTQLKNFISAFSSGNAVIVMGDLNCRYTRSGDNIRDLASLELTDAWVELVRRGVAPARGNPALVCSDSVLYPDSQCEIVDKVFYRGNTAIELTPTAFSYEENKFRDENNGMLSDHRPVHVRFDWWFLKSPAAPDSVKTTAAAGKCISTDFPAAEVTPKEGST